MSEAPTRRSRVVTPRGAASGWNVWNGTTEVAATAVNVWNGTTEVPIASWERAP